MKTTGAKNMKAVTWDLALSTALRMAPLREHYVETQRHTDVASQLNILLANREMAKSQFKPDRKMGLLVVGETGAGKTTLLKRLVKDHPYLQGSRRVANNVQPIFPAEETRVDQARPRSFEVF